MPKILRRKLIVLVLPLLSGCVVGHQMLGLGGGDGNTGLGQTVATPVVFGYAVADEPQAALVARQILDQGGNAADAAAAAGFALAVTLPSRAGLGGGGACVIKMPDPSGNAQPAVTLIFPPAAPATAGGARPAAVPEMARGLLALQARFGRLPYAAIIVPAERLAAGVPVSPALASDLQIVGPALLADPSAAAVFGAPSGGVLAAGATLAQPDLAASLEILRTQGVPGFTQGQFAGQFLAAASLAGARITPTDIATALPVFGRPAAYTSHGDDIAMLPTTPPASTTLPASAAFGALDKNGGAVVCATTMNNLFGNGRVAPGTGILLAASPKNLPPAILAAGIASSGKTFYAAVTGTGEAGAGQAAIDAMENALHKNPTAPVAAPGRANIITCPGGVPGGEASCTATADPRGQGLATGGR